MSRSWIIRGILIAGVALLIFWVSQRTYWDDTTVPLPLRGEAASNPFYSAQRFAESLGARTEWHSLLGELPPTDAVLVLSYWHWSVIESRREQLEDWVMRGGRLIVDRTLVGGREELEQWSGIERVRLQHDRSGEDKSAPEVDAEADEQLPELQQDPEETPAPDAEDAEDSEEFAIDPEASHPLAEQLGLMTGTCATLHTDAVAGATRDYEVCSLNPHHRFETVGRPVWSLHDDEGMQAVRVALGAGSVTQLNAEPFGNRSLLNVDHAALFVAATQLRRGDHIVFIHERDHASLLALIWRHGAPVVVLMLLALALSLWRDGVRFGPLSATADPARRSLAEQIRGTARFTARVGGGQELFAATVRALHEAAGERIAGYHRLSDADRLAALATLTTIDAEQLAALINYTGVRRGGELRAALGTLEAARRRLQNARQEP